MKIENFKVGEKVYSDYTKKYDVVKKIIEEQCFYGEGLAYHMRSGYCYWVKNNNISFTARKQQLRKNK